MTPNQILASPDYQNANAATRAAIFDKHVGSSQDYMGANDATKEAIRSRFGLTGEATQTAQAPQAAQAPLTSTQQRNTRALQSQINPIQTVKNLGKGLASAIDTGIVEPAVQFGKQVIFPTVRTTLGPERAEALTKSVLPSTLGKTFGIEDDPAYKGEASRRFFTSVGEKVGPYADKAVTTVSEATGLPKQDVGNIASNIALGLPIVGYGKLGGKPSIAQARAQAIREIDAANQIPDAVARAPRPEPAASDILRTPVAPIARESTPSAPSASSAALPPNQIPARPTTVTPQQARANALRQPQGWFDESTLSGVGSADVGKMKARVDAAENLPIPINLTKGKRTQELGQLQEENRLRYAHADEPSGRILLAEDAIANERYRQNVDYLIDDMIGSANPKDRGAFGDMLNQDFRAQLASKNTKANKLFDDARNSPEAQMLLPANVLENYINSKTAATRKAAPILDVVESVLDGRKEITLGELMEIRPLLNKAARTVDTNGHFAGELKGLLDDVARQAEQGAPKFARAQKYYRLVKQEFEGKGAIEKFSHNKLNSSDPKVAAESVVTNIINGSKRDVDNIVRRIKRSKNGDQIMRELRGNVVDHIFERATKGIGKDVEGNAVVSFSGLKAALKPLEDKKIIDAILTPKERTLLHEIVVTADTLFNEPALAKNYSGSAYGLAGEAKRLMRRLGNKVPGLNALVEHAEEQARLASAREAIRPDPKKLEKELKAIDARNKKERKGL